MLGELIIYYVLQMFRIYVEKDGENVRKLYITSIQKQDEGSYFCSAVVARQRLEKNITMMLFSACFLLTYFFCLFCINVY